MFEPTDIETLPFKYSCEEHSDLKEILGPCSIADLMSIKEHIRLDGDLFKYLRGLNAQRRAVKVEGSVITSLLLFEAQQYLKKAFLNYCAHNVLYVKGFFGWSEVTNYYSSFYSINALLRLQGKAILFFSPGNTIYLFPHEFESHSYIMEKARVKKSVEGDEFKSFSEKHADIWREYYNHYHRFNYNRDRYRTLYVVGEENEITFEVEKRNNANYNIMYQLSELKATEEISEKISNYKERRLVQNLHALETDPEYNCFARSGSRIVLLMKLFDYITQDNPTRSRFDELVSNTRSFLTPERFSDNNFRNDLIDVLY